jgi:hypothetical protein
MTVYGQPLDFRLARIEMRVEHHHICQYANLINLHRAQAFTILLHV